WAAPQYKVLPGAPELVVSGWELAAIGCQLSVGSKVPLARAGLFFGHNLTRCGAVWVACHPNRRGRGKGGAASVVVMPRLSLERVSQLPRAGLFCGHNLVGGGAVGVASHPNREER